jgi:hypothetical protein
MELWDGAKEGVELAARFVSCNTRKCSKCTVHPQIIDPTRVNQSVF